MIKPAFLRGKGSGRLRSASEHQFLGIHDQDGGGVTCALGTCAQDAAGFALIYIQEFEDEGEFRLDGRIGFFDRSGVKPNSIAAGQCGDETRAAPRT